MDSYKVSKAWHVAHQLAVGVHGMVPLLPPHELNKLSLRLRKSSATVPLKMEESLKYDRPQERLRCYIEARDALTDLQKRLRFAKDLNYIQQAMHDDLAHQAIYAHYLLQQMIQTLSAQLEQTK